MEEVTEGIKLAELDIERLRKTLDQAHAQSSSILLFTREWKELENHFDLIEKSLLKRAKELVLQEEELRERNEVVVRREKDVEIKLKRIEDCHDEIEMEERQLSLIEKRIAGSTSELKLNQNQLNLIRTEVEGCSRERALKQGQLSLVQEDLQKCSVELSTKKEQLGTLLKIISECSAELMCKRAELELIKSSIAQCSKGLNSPGRKMAFFNPTDSSSENAMRTARNLVLGSQELTNSEVSAAIQLFPDPAKFVLEVLQGSFSCKQSSEVVGFGSSMKNKVLLLEQLKELSPKLSDLVKTGATDLASLWKENLMSKTADPVEVLAFLLFVDVYGLAGYFQGDDIMTLVWSIAHHKKAPEICGTLGLSGMIPDLIEKLIKMNQCLEAARFSCAFGLADKFSPRILFNDYLRNAIKDAANAMNENSSLEVQHNARDKQVAAVRAILECMEDCKHEDRVLTKILKDRLVGLEKSKAAADTLHQPRLMYPILPPWSTSSSETRPPGVDHDGV